MRFQSAERIRTHREELEDLAETDLPVADIAEELLEMTEEES